MSKQATSLLILIAVAFAAVGCYRGVRVGDLQTKSQTIERDDADGLTRDGNRYINNAYGVSDVTLHIDINGGVGDINLDVES